MTASLVGIREKIKRADQHIRKVAKTDRLFREKCVCAVVHHYDENTRRHTYKLAGIKQPRISFSRISIVTGEAVNQLRSVLDHLVCQLIIRECSVNGKPPPKSLSGRGFPVEKDPLTQKSEPNFLSKIEGVPSAAQAEIKRLQPYNPANGRPDEYALSILSKLNNTDKHRLLLAVAATAGQTRRVMTLTADNLGDITHLLGRHMAGPRGLGSFVRLEDGAEICEPYEAGPDVKMGIQTTPRIAIQGASPAEFHPVVPRLNNLRDFVVGIVDDFEAKFFG